MITSGRIKYYVKDGEIHISSVNSGSTDQYGHISVYVTFEANKIYKFMYDVTSIGSVDNTGFDSGWFLNDKYDYYIFSVNDCTLKNGETIRVSKTFTPTQSGRFGLRFDTNFDNVSVIVSNIKIIEQSN